MFDALLPSHPRRDGHDGEHEVPRRRAPVPWWKLGVGFVAALGVLELLGSVHGTAVVVVLVCAFGALGLSGWAWGYDSRDGADWRSGPPA